MIYTTPDKTNIQTDIAIIGSGCGGAMTAAFMAEQGFDVLVIEEGEYVDRAHFNQNPRELIPKMYRQNAALATDDQSIRILQGKVYGGSTTINWMTSLRTPSHVLDEWADLFGLEEYRPHSMELIFEDVEKRLNVHKVPEWAISPANQVILDGALKLGMHADRLPNNSKNCIGCGGCGLGCHYDAKMDMRLTYLEDARKNGTHIYTSTRAYLIRPETDERQLVKAINLKTEETLSIHAKRTVVAGSAIMTPLLLQKSKLIKSKLVGKHLHLHPTAAVVGRFEREINPTYGIPQSAVAEHNPDGTGYGYWIEAPDTEYFLAGVNHTPTGNQRREDLKQLRYIAPLIILTRDGADKKSSGEVRWRRGLNLQNGRFSLKPFPSIRYKISPTDKRHLLMGVETAIRMLFAAGAVEVLPYFNPPPRMTKPEDASIVHKLNSGPNQISMFSAHPTGTARMSSTQKTGVVDKTGKLHHYNGIYVLDGSILPTAPGVNPMITILATVKRALQIGNLNL